MAENYSDLGYDNSLKKTWSITQAMEDGITEDGVEDSATEGATFGDNILGGGTGDGQVNNEGFVTTVPTSILSGYIPQANLSIADRGWTQTSAFSVTDADTIAWGAGTFTSADGTAYSIDAGNTGNMAAKTYIYLDIDVSETVYQTTTSGTTAVGTNKVMIAVAQNGTAEATFQVLQGQGGQNIDAANIVAGSITANEIAASTITAGLLNVSTLSAITANLGTITAGSISGITITGGTITTTAGTNQRIVIASSDNTLRMYDSSNNEIVTMDDQGSSGIIALMPQGAGDAGLKIATPSALTFTGRGIDVNILKSDSTGKGMYISHAGTGVGLQIDANNTSKGIVVSAIGNIGIEVDQDSSEPALKLSQTIGANAIADLSATYSSADNITGIKFDLVNDGAGNEFAFDFHGEEIDTTKTSVSGIAGAIKIKIAGAGTYYIPVYDTAT